MEILKVEGVTKNFDQLVALRAVDVTLYKGDILGMIGPNGSGKTTLFNVISGIYAPASGNVRYKGQFITNKKPHVICRMGIARTFQIVQPFSQMTLLENVLIGAMYGRGLKPAAGRDKAEEILQFVGLKDKIYFTPNEITTEDRRRLELARALATEPEVLLLDEIMAGLTPAEIEEALHLIRQINSRGITIFMVEHIMKAVMSICQRVVVLNYGEKIAEGSPQEVAENSEVIKAYLGDRYV
ncbi:MAG: ABC transporter ATP-binding protein [Deltaproteobacteria bacterium]|nr:ABC transporter ATP-binding protein [Deltaproteobacteria bacterium]